MRRVLIFILRFYQKYLSQLKGKPTCIFYPSCSEYAVQAIMKYGIIKGLALATWRVLRCNPFSHGGYDPLK